MSFDAAGQALVTSGAFGEHWLVTLEFSGGNLCLTTFNQTVTIGGRTYLGMGGNLTVSQVKETDRLSNDKVTLGLPAANQALVSATISNIEGYRGRPATLSLQLFSPEGLPVGEPKLRLRARMEPAEIKYDSLAEKSGGGTIELTLLKEGRGRSRNMEGRRLNDAQQRAEFPNDTGLRFQRQMVEQPALWLSKRFQQV